MVPKSETYVFSQVNELRQIHENILLNVFNSIIDRLVKKSDIIKKEISKIKKELKDLKGSFQYHSDNIDLVNEKLVDIDRRIEDIKLD